MRYETLAPKEVETIPERLEGGVLYISRRYGVAIHLCACGCGVQTVTPFGTASGWELTEGPTLHPSIGNQQFPCHSHYWVQGGRIVWC